MGVTNRVGGAPPTVAVYPQRCVARVKEALERLGVANDQGAAITLVDLRCAKPEDLVGIVPTIAIAGAGEETALDAAVARGTSYHLPAPFDDKSLARVLRMAGVLPRAAPPALSIASAIAAEPGGYVLRIALSRFDVVNAAFGREQGDALLDAALNRIRALAGPGMPVERLPGPEFAALVFGRAQECADGIIDALDHPYLADGRALRIGCLVGIAPVQPDDDASRAIQQAGLALQLARSGATSVAWLPQDDPRTLALIDGSLERDLREALELGQIEVVFQPQVRIADDTVVGVEALARWRHPVTGEIGAGTLFTVAARAELTSALSAHVQRLAVREAAAWPAALDHLRLSVNVSAKQFENPRFVQEFTGMAEASGFSCSRLTVELTESELALDLDAAAAMLGELRASSCRVAIDDFGTGYSSLAYLKALPVDYLKIDKGLAQDIIGSPRDRVIVRGVIELARSLNIAVIAEGIETGEQRALLAAEGCQYYQGFLYAPALSSSALIERLKR